MVLQRERPIPLWGTAAPGAQVACRLEPAVAAASGQADGAGSWRITLPALPAGGPYTLTITAGSQTVCLDDVWLGEVWLAGGQSNMELPLANSRDGQAVLARCADPASTFTSPQGHHPEAARAAPPAGRRSRRTPRPTSRPWPTTRRRPWPGRWMSM